MIKEQEQKIPRMRIITLVKRNILYHWKTHISLFLGSVLAAAMVIGALTVGDSVRESLKQITLQRLGKTVYGIELKEGFVRTGLARDLSHHLGSPVVPLLRVDGVASLQGGRVRTPGVTVYGIDEQFPLLIHQPGRFFLPGPGEGYMNRRLAERLGVKEGDTVQIRIQEQTAIPPGIPFSDNKGTTHTLRIRILSVLDRDRLGNFSLRIHQVPPLNLYLPASDMFKALSLENKANIFLVPGDDTGRGSPGSPSREDLAAALKNAWEPRDGGIIIEEIDNSLVRLRSEKIFIDSKTAEAALEIHPRAEGVFTYFVNEITFPGTGSSPGKGRSVPYSFISAAGLPFVPPGMGDNEIIINEWLARELGCAIGDRLRLSFFVPGEFSRLSVRDAELRVHGIIPTEPVVRGQQLVPPFPGLSGVTQCRNWDPGIPLDLEKIREEDEAYWNRYGELPKGFITLQTAQQIWNNPFGNLTSIHYPANETSVQSLDKALQAVLDPGDYGLAFIPFRKMGIAAGDNSVDFGGLFIGLSFFIIIAALLLVSQFIAVEKDFRSSEFGLLRSLGFSRTMVMGIFFLETGIIVTTGALAGIPAGLFYNQGVLWGLNTLWQGAVHTDSLVLVVLPMTLCVGFLVSIGISALVILLSLWKTFSLPAITLTRSEGLEPGGMKKSLPRVSLVSFILCSLFICILFVSAIMGIIDITSTHFFIAGILLLISSLSFVRLVLARTVGRKKERVPGIISLGLSKAALETKKTMMTTSLLAFGIFVIMTVGVYQGKLPPPPGLRTSGTGGFLLYGETSLPVTEERENHDILAQILDSVVENKEVDDMAEESPGEGPPVAAIRIKVQDGDDASCLNLNQVAVPRVLGINPGDFSSRGAFSFAQSLPPGRGETPWDLLLHRTEEGNVPVVADQTVIVWGLGKKLGDTMVITDEQGKDVKVQLVGGLENSIFQGNLLMAGRFFRELFPSESGYRVFLIDSPPENEPEIIGGLRDGLKHLGPEIIPARERLAAFGRVEHTYLSIFLLLGGIGVFLGSLGFGIIVLRKIFESQKEYAILRAVGFKKTLLFRLIMTENAFLLISGLACGIISGASAHALYSISQRIEFSPLFIIIVITGIFISGLAWIAGITLFLFSSPFLPALRNE